MVTKRKIERDLYKLFNTFFNDEEKGFVVVKCLRLYNAYNPSTDEVITYCYKVHLIIDDTLYVYDGWCYMHDLDQVALGIYSHWLLENYKIYKGESTAWHNMYTCGCNLVPKGDSK